MIKKFEIDFELVDKLFKKLAKCFENEQKMRSALERLIEVFSFVFQSSQKTFEDALMVWRGMTMLL
jgi:hypothetical protein